MIRAMLVAYDDADKTWGYEPGPRQAAAQELDTPTCATCRWAQPQNPFDDLAANRHITLRCAKLTSDSDSRAHANINAEYGHAPAFLVAPDFGCVQWEGK